MSDPLQSYRERIERLASDIEVTTLQREEREIYRTAGDRHVEFVIAAHVYRTEPSYGYGFPSQRERFRIRSAEQRGRAMPSKAGEAWFVEEVERRGSAVDYRRTDATELTFADAEAWCRRRIAADDNRLYEVQIRAHYATDQAMRGVEPERIDRPPMPAWDRAA